MMNIAETISQVCADTHYQMIDEVFGAAGIDALFKVMETVKEFYRHVEPERISGQIIIFQAISPCLREGPATDFSGMANTTVSNLCIEIAADGRPYKHTLGAVTPEELAQTSVVYHWHYAEEKFFAGTESKPVLRLDTSALSQFSVPSLTNLREALQKYAIENVLESTCCIFDDVWYDENRLFLVSGPESQMRRSLIQFLKNRMGDYDVLPEQPVDESHPVDIRVQARLSNNRWMLIEIKWLGDSADSTGHITVQHRDSRAKAGAVQLAEYIDGQRRSTPNRVIHGYLVVIDARRKNLPDIASREMTITRVEGLHYENQEIEFNPAFHLTRKDFDPPYRMFARPKCCE